MKKPLVTVLLPVYNNEKVGKAIKSVLAQSYKDFELLIIDNASTDNTVKVISKFKDKRIKLVQNKKNIGPTGSLNKGVKSIKTKYIARIDADDLMLPDRLKKQVEFLEEYPEFGIVGSWTQNIDENDQPLEVHKLCTTDKGVRLFQNLQSAFYHPAVMIRTSVLKDNKLNYDLDIKVAVEYKLWNEILKYKKGKNLPEVLTYYRVGNKNSLTASNANTRLQEYLDVRKQVLIDDDYQDDLLKCLELERKEKKSLSECISITKYLLNYLNSNMNKDEEDYESLKSCVYSRIYQAIALENDTKLGKTLTKLMRLYK